MEMASTSEEAIRLFPSASQPAIIRAEQKDELYRQYLVDCCHDVVRRLLGPRRALLWARETRALAQLLYYSLTTGTGSQTLGEEYCDILQATGALGMAPGAARRGMLVLLQGLGPYLAEQLAAPPDDGLAAWQAARLQHQQLEQQQQGPPAWWMQLWLRTQAAATALRTAAQGAVRPLAQRFPQATLFLREHWGSLLRLHLALFYLYGNYYQLSKRTTGVRYLFLGRSFEGRPSYHVLGLLLCAQIGLSAGLWMLRSAGGSRLPALLRGGGGEPAKPRHAVLLDEAGRKPADEEGGSDTSSSAAATAAAAAAATAADKADPSGVVPASRKCPLCLSVRDCPTATPCGHVFCWQCIAEWCSQRELGTPLCPLCRSDVPPSSLVPVRHCGSDF